MDGITDTEYNTSKWTENWTCETEKVTLKTERTEKEHKFLFWSLSRKKVTVIDNVLDSNGNTIFKEKSVYICSMDACDDRRFRRIKIVDKEIWLFHSNNTNFEKAYIKRYDFCGNYLGKKDWENWDYYAEPE